MINKHTLFALGRVSNLPTIWSNTMVGIALAQQTDAGLAVLLPFIAMSLFYTGGMFLNDAFDADIDASNRSDRPIPSGDIARVTVFQIGFAQLAVALIIIALISVILNAGIKPVFFAAVLGASIVLYDWHHKTNPISPLIMGVCRCMVYLCCYSLFATELNAEIILASAVLLSYLIGLTFTAKQENLKDLSNVWPLGFLAIPMITGVVLLFEHSPLLAPPWVILCAVTLFAVFLLRRRNAGDIPVAVQQLIAGISLLDAMWIASTGNHLCAFIAALGYPLTLYLQRFYRGT